MLCSGGTGTNSRRSAMLCHLFCPLLPPTHQLPIVCIPLLREDCEGWEAERETWMFHCRIYPTEKVFGKKVMWRLSSRCALEIFNFNWVEFNLYYLYCICITIYIISRHFSTVRSRQGHTQRGVCVRSRPNETVKEMSTGNGKSPLCFKNEMRWS